MTAILVNTTVRQQSFPFGTVAGSWRWKLLKGDGTFVSEQFNTGPVSVQFPNVVPGDYKVQAQRLDNANNPLGTVAESNLLTVPDPGVNIDVPNTVTISIA